MKYLSFSAWQRDPVDTDDSFMYKIVEIPKVHYELEDGASKVDFGKSLYTNFKFEKPGQVQKSPGPLMNDFIFDTLSDAMREIFKKAFDR